MIHFYSNWIYSFTSWFHFIAEIENTNWVNLIHFDEWGNGFDRLEATAAVNALN